jgi:hypothetical protein
MAYLGTYELGQEVRLALQTTNGNDTPSFPLAVPTLQVWSSSANVTPSSTANTGNASMHVVDRYQRTGVFAREIYLDSRFAVGFYRVYYFYLVGTFYGVQVDYFEIIAGGNPAGAVVGMHHFSPPHAKFVVQHLDGGTIATGRNPYV